MRPLLHTEAFTIFARDAVPRVESARWTQQARTFLDAEVTVVSDVRAPLPESARIELDVASATRAPTRVAITTFPISSGGELLAAAERGVLAIGGAGFDALLARAKRIWQVPIDVDAIRARRSSSRRCSHRCCSDRSCRPTRRPSSA
jgi:hypothetical protein